MKRIVSIALLVLPLAAAAAAAAANPGYCRFPAIRGDSIVFTSEGDLWKVGIAGGVAQRLTSHPGEETHAAISPDGTRIAFSAAYEGPTEVYVMPLAGGLPRRLTWEGGSAIVVGWTPDGKVLAATRRYSTLPNTQLEAIDPASGARTLVPLAQASDGSYDERGTLFFTRLGAQGSHTKRYRGGTAQNLWRFDRGASEAAPLTADYPGTSRAPMWWRGRVYFASDRDGTMNLWSMDERGGDLRQLTRHQGWDVLSPALGDGRIAYQLGAALRVYDIGSGKDSAVPVALASDFDQLREKWIDKPLDYLTAAHLAPDGERIALTVRGQVLIAPVKQGRVVEASHLGGVRYRSAHFAGDGKSVVALSDRSGEVEWWRLAANGVGEPEQLTTEGKVLKFDGVPSPDGAWIAYFDKDDALWLWSEKERRSVKVAESREGQFSGLAWSPDSRWLAYQMPAENGFDRIMLHAVADGTALALTTDRTDNASPAWSPDGKWVYLLSDRNLVSAVSSPWGSRQPEPFLDRPTGIYAVALRAGLRSPFAPGDELHPAAEKRDAEKRDVAKPHGPAGGNGADKPDAAAPKPAPAVTIDADGLAARIVPVPVPPGDYDSLSVNGDRLFWLSRPPAGERKAALMFLEITNRDPKPKTLVEGVAAYELSADGKRILVRKDDTLAVFDASADKVDLAEKKVDTAGWRFAIDPREEWRQMFREAWRLERDYFYDRKMNGVDWPAMRAKYEPLVELVADRAELSDLLGQMVGELSALHMFVYGGDARKGPDDVEPASLGAELARDEAAGGWRVAHVYRSDPDYPDRLSPLAAAGVDVREGDVIQAINGVPTLSAPDPAELLRDQAGRQVLLHVASGAAARDVVAVPISPERATELRYDEWEYTRRLRVDEAGKGEIGYVHLRAMSRADWTEWAREFYPVFKRAGLIVDVRHNRGGNIDSWIIEKLLRRAWFFWQPRVGDTYWNMQYAFRGHVAVLIDQSTASDGEAFAEGIRRLGIGKLLGVRTWGGEIWLSSSNFLVDKGIATAAETGVFGPEGEWLIEGHGVEPDIAVDDLPAATFAGGDAQLDAAVRYLQDLIRREPVPTPNPPPYPNKAWPPAPK